jgi:tetratricopeptide (TPR) repeat protein
MIRIPVSPLQLNSPATSISRIFRRGPHPLPGPVLLLMVPLMMSLIVGCTSDVDSRLEAAYDLQEAGHLQQSIVSLREVLAEDAGNPEANFLLGIALVQTNQLMVALPPLKIATNSELYVVPAGLLLSSTQYRTKAYEDAIRTSDRILEIDPDNLTALFTRGQSHLALGNTEEALAHANLLLDYRPAAQNAIIMKAESLVQLDRRDEAEAIWVEIRDEAAASGTPNQAARACAQLAHFYRIHEEDQRADQTYTECLESYPTHTYLQKSASNFYIRRDQPKRAIEIHQRAVDASPDDIRTWSRLARVLHDYGNPGEAQTKLEQAVERFDSPSAWRLLAEFHRKARRTTEARKALEEAILRSPQPQEAFLFSLADLLVEEGQIQRAREVGEKLTEPSYQYLLRGAISLKTGDAQRALEQLDAGLELWPDNSNAHYLAGRAALLLRDRRRAVVEFQEAVRIGDNATDAALRLAEISFARGSYLPAWKLAQFQIAQRPYLDPTPYHIAIRSALRLNRIDDAIQVANALRDADPTAAAVVVEMAAIERMQSGSAASSEYVLASGRDLSDPENETILRTLATDLNSLGRAAEALELIDAAIAHDGNSAQIHDLRARVLSHLSRTEEASLATDRALEIDSTFAPALEMKAFFALNAGDEAIALAALDAATEAAPSNSDYPYSAASLARKMGDTVGAISRLEETLARQPLLGPAANDLAWILATDRLDLERALRLAQVAARQDRSSDTLTTLGWVRHQRGEYDHAIRIYRTALETDANLPTVRYRLGLSLSEAGHTSEAQGLFDELVEGPEFPEIDAARAELARIKGS